MEKTTKTMERWWRVPLLLLACLFGGSSPTWARTEFVNACSIVQQPRADHPYITLEMIYYDWSNGSNSFFLHDKGDGSHDGPAIYVDGNYICSPDDELAWPGGDGNGNGTDASGIVSKDGWFGTDYSKTVNGINYHVRFWNPKETDDSQTRHRKFSMRMCVYISQMEIGASHTVRIKGKWRIMDSATTKEKDQNVDYTWTTNPVPCPWGNAQPTAMMTSINEVTVTGTLNSSYPTNIGFNGTSEGECSGYVENPEDKEEFKNVSSFSKTGTHKRTDAHQLDGSRMGVEYLVPCTADGFTSTLYKWYNIDVPGFVYPYDLSATEFLWDKTIKLEWKKDDTNSRSQKGKWRIFRNGEQIVSEQDYGITNYTDKVPEYDKQYTYIVAFVPDKSESGKYVSQLSKTVSKAVTRNWSITSFKGELVDGDTHINLTWSHTAIDNASSQNSYTLTLERRDASQSNASWETLKTFTISSSSTKNGSYLDNQNLIGNHTYQYRLSISLLEKDLSATIDGIRLGGSSLLDFSATRGTYNNMVKLSWNVKQVGVNETSFKLYRRPLGSESEKDWKQIYTTSGTGSSYSYDDNTVLTGTFNEYKLSIVGMEGTTEKTYSSLFTDGFTFATGVVSGRITYGTGTAVDSVKVMLKQQTAEGDEAATGMSSLRFTGAGAGMAYHTDNAEIKELFSGDFSVQMFVKPVREEMASNGQDYLVFDVQNVFTIRLWYNSADSTFTVGGWMTENQKTPFKIKATEWSQLTFVHSHANKKTDVYVATTDTIMKTTILSNKQVSWTGNALNANTVAIGNGGSMNSAGNYRGFVDEFRLFTKALTEGEVKRNFNHPLAGNEDGLAIYYPFDEGLGKQKIAYDYSKTNGIANGRHATNDVAATSYDDVLPNAEQLSMMAYTDTLGNYTIRGVYFKGEGTAYSVIPSLGIHEFSPSAQSRFVSQSSLIHSGVDFEDISSFPVSGNVYYENTDYPVEGCNLYVDGTICSKNGELIETDENGAFTISVPIGDHFITVKKNGHEFVNGGRYPADPNGTGKKITFNKARSGMEFFDATVVNFTGRVIGGDIEGEKHVGFGLSKNNIGKARLTLLPPQPDTYRMNLVKKVTDTSSERIPNPNILEMASAKPDTIKSYSWRGASKDCSKLYIETDPETGEFSAMLPPLFYTLQSIHVDATNLDVISEPMTIDLTQPLLVNTDSIENGKSYDKYDYNTLLRQTYHSTPTFNVVQRDREDGSFGINTHTIDDAQGKLEINDFYKNGVYTYGFPIFKELDTYVFEMEGYEEYVNKDSGTEVISKVPLAGNVVTIANALSSEQAVYGEGNAAGAEPGSIAELAENQLKLDDNGKVAYRWKAGMPNISDPYWRTINIYYEIGDVSYDWTGNPMKGIVLGSLPTGNNFVTSGPDMIDMILRDPPGTGSSAEWSKGTVHSTSHSRGGTWTSETSGKTTSHMGVDVETGVGAIGIFKFEDIETKWDLEVGVKVVCEGEDAKTWGREVTTTKAISTSDSPDFVGADGDVFIGSATNIIFGKARDLDLYRDEKDPTKAVLKLDDIITTGLKFGTEFSYTQSYIENTLIPNLKALRNSKLKHVTTIEGYKCEGNIPEYITTLTSNDPNYGASNHDKDAWGKKATSGPMPEGPSYTMVVPDKNKNYQDSVEWCNNQIRIWQSYLALNEAEKAQAYEQRNDSTKNYSFDAGAKVTNSTEISTSKGSTYECQVTSAVILGFTWGMKANKTGTTWEVGTETGGGEHFQDEETTTEKESFSYTLAEEGSDAISVDVYEYGAFGPIFRTRGGQTSNPYEGKVETKYYEPGTTIMEATMQIEVPTITVDNPIMNDVPTGTAANYTLRLGNASEIGEDVAYRLFVLDESNPDGAQLTVDGKVLTTGRLIKVPASQTLTKALQLRQTNMSVLDYDSIAVVFASDSQPEDIFEVVYLSAHFVPSSSPVTLALSNTTINTETGSDLTLTFKDFDRNYHNLKAFRLQYKQQGATDWTMFHEYVLDENPKNLGTNSEILPKTGSSVSYTLPMAPMPDGNYMFRVVSVSSHGSGEVKLESNEIALVKDMVRPRPLGIPEPSDGILDTGDDISVTFNENILTGELTNLKNFLVTGVLNGAEVAHGTALGMKNTETTATTEASITLAGKDFSTDMWVHIDGAGTILSHGTGSNKLTVGTDAKGELVVTLGGDTCKSVKKMPVGKWAFLTLSYKMKNGVGALSASVASDAETTDLFDEEPVGKYEGVGPLAVGMNLNGAIHELLLWDEAHDMTTALANRSKTKNPLTRHLIGYWKMDEGEGTTIRDYARSRHMTMPTETWHLENENLAVGLDGKHYVSINTSMLQIFEGDDYAVEFWMRGSKQQADTAQLLQMGEVALSVTKDGNLQLTGKGAYLPKTQPNSQFSILNSQLLDNAWHHVALNVLRQGAAAVYVDGKRVLTTSANNVGGIASDKLLLGARRTNGNTFSHPFTGQVDELRVWNASMNADQLAKQRKVRLTGREEGLAAYYPFEKKTLDDYNQVVTLGTDSCLTGGDIKARLIPLTSSTPQLLSYTDNAPALREKPSETNVSFTYVASDTKVVINIDEDPATIEGTTLNFTVRDVRDVNGNKSTPAVWSAFVNQKELVWQEGSVSCVTEATEGATIAATIVNKSGKQQMWTLDGMPSWLQASTEYGTTNPLEETKVTFTVSPATPIGKYEETIYLKGNNGIETPLTINVKVKGNEPLWSVDPGEFELTMNVIGSLVVIDTPSENEDDIVAAFIDGKCCGVAKPQYLKRFDSYFLTMDIYGKAAETDDKGNVVVEGDTDKEIEFKVYDASTGIIYPVVNTSVPVTFEDNKLLGLYDAPVVLTATDEIEQNIDLGKGWNWMSLSVSREEFTVPMVFAKANDKVNMVKAQKGVKYYSNGNWAGTLNAMTSDKMYAVKTSDALTLSVTGHRVVTSAAPITVGSMWNWVGYNASSLMSVTEALAGMNPQDGDIIKAQRGLAYYDSGEWLGSLQTMVPGKGYKVKSVVAADRTFSYPEKTATGGASRLAKGTPEDQTTRSLNNQFTPVDYRDYPANMVLIAQVVGNASQRYSNDNVPLAGVELGVFAGDECREAAVTDEQGMIYITIPGDEPCELTFSIAINGQCSMVNGQSITYETDAVIGTPRAPFIIDLGEATGIAEIENGKLKMENVYDLQGRRMESSIFNSQSSTLRKGVYIVNGQKKVK